MRQPLFTTTQWIAGIAIIVVWIASSIVFAYGTFETKDHGVTVKEATDKTISGLSEDLKYIRGKVDRIEENTK